MAARNVDVFGSVLLELVFPIDLEPKPVNIEFLGFLFAQGAQDWDGASEFHRHGVTLSLSRDPTIVAVQHLRRSEPDDASAP